MTIETRFRHPEYVKDGKMYYIEVNIGPFNKTEYQKKVKAIKELCKQK